MAITRSDLEHIAGHETKKLPSLEDGTGNAAIIRTLQDWGIYLYSGVNGGGVIHFARYLRPLRSLQQVRERVPQFFTINEDIASFIPVGYHWATGRIAASLSTTGAAAFYVKSGLLAAKMHNIPMAVIAALSGSRSHGKSPLQYTGKDGSNTIGGYRSLLGKRAIVLDDVESLEEKLYMGQEGLQESKPVAFLIVPDKMSQKVHKEVHVPWQEQPRTFNENDIRRFLSKFPEETKGRRVIIYVGEEAAKYQNIQNIRDLITQFSERLQAPVVYAMNSVNAVSPNNRFAAGFIGFGFNDFSWHLWQSLTKDDVVVCIGYDPGEYEMNSANIPARVWHLTNEVRPYGSKNGSFAHRVDGKYTKVRGDLELTLQAINEGFKDKKLNNNPITVPENLNVNEDYGPIEQGTVDLVEFYKVISKLVKPNSYWVHDVCQFSKDEQRVKMRSIPGVMRWDAHRDSFMSGGLGVALGIKMGLPESEVDYWLGDGCLKYNGAAWDFARNFGIGIWIADNGNHHIVDTGLDVIYGAGLDRERHHAVVPRSDYVRMAKEGLKLDGHAVSPDLRDLKHIIDTRYLNSQAATPLSTVVQLNIDGMRVIGQNPRLLTLGRQGRPNL